MYCKNCGKKNINNQTYCSNCGHPLQDHTISMDKRDILEERSSYCKNCSNKLEKDRYCTNCGRASYSVEFKEDIIFKVPDIKIGSVDDIKEKIQKSQLGEIKNIDDVKDVIKSQPILKDSLFSALKILGAGLGISLLIFLVIFNIGPLKELFAGIEEAANYGFPQMKKMKPNFIDFFNLSLLSPIKLSFSMKGEEYGQVLNISSKILLSFKPLILLIVPIGSVIAGQFKLFKSSKKSKESFLEYGLTSFFFTIMVGLISLFNSRSIKITDTYLNLKVRLNFQTIGHLIAVFFIIFAIQLIIGMIIKKDNPFEILNTKLYDQLGDKVHTYLKGMGLFVSIITIEMILVLIITLTLKAKMPFPIAIITGIIIGPILFLNGWLMSSGFSLSNKVGSFFTLANISIWSGFKGAGKLKSNFIFDAGGLRVWAYLFLFLLIIGFVYVIYNVIKEIEINEMEIKDYFLKLGLIAGCISLINIFLSYGGRTLVNMSNKLGDSIYGPSDILKELSLDFLASLLESGAIKQSYNIFNIILVTFIVIFAIGSILYFLKTNGKGDLVTNFVNQYNKKLIIGYSLLFLIITFLLLSKIITVLTSGIGDISSFLNFLF